MKSKGNNNKPVLKVVTTKTLQPPKRYHSADVCLVAITRPRHNSFDLMLHFKYSNHCNGTARCKTILEYNKVFTYSITPMHVFHVKYAFSIDLLFSQISRQGESKFSSSSVKGPCKSQHKTQQTSMNWGHS
jgi:hypothetical protein